jgi:hypothetical protein
MESVLQVVAAMYVALSESGGSSKAANRILRDAIADRVIDDPLAIGVLQSLAHDEDGLTLVTGGAA